MVWVTAAQCISKRQVRPSERKALKSRGWDWVGSGRRGSFTCIPLHHHFAIVRAPVIVGEVVACPTVYALTTFFRSWNTHLAMCTVTFDSSVAHGRLAGSFSAAESVC